MKKIIIITMLAFLMNIVPVAAITTTIGINNVSTTPLNTNYAIISLNNMNNFGVADIDFYYDPGTVNIMDARIGFAGYGGSLTPNINNNIGKASFLITTTAIPGPNSPLPLLNVSLKAVGQEGKSSALGLVVATLTDTDGIPSLDLTTNNGTFTILSYPDTEKTSSSSSGGSGGGTSGELFTNIEVMEKYTLFINKNVATSYVFKKVDPIVSINITGNTSAGDINVAIEVLKNTSSLVKYPAPETVFKNVNIWVGTSGFATSKNIKHAEIIFRIPRLWISSNGIDPDSINMMHYQGGWASLPTKKISETTEWIYYEASTTSFSPFAIIGTKLINKNRNLSAQMNNFSESNRSINNSQIETGNSNIYLIIGTFIGVILIVLLVYKFRKPK